MEINSCRICQCALNFDVVHVGDKGLQKLLKVSETRGDNLFLNVNEDKIALHAKCRAKYTNEKCIKAALKKPTSGAKLDGFDFNKQCLFCTNDASDEYVRNETKKTLHLRDIVSRVLLKSTSDSIIQASLDHLDPWSKEVRERIENKDLPNLNARYHRKCYARFLKRRPSSAKIGRPESTAIKEDMEYVFEFIDSNMEDSQFTIENIRNAIADRTLPDSRTIKRKLQEHYGENLIITEKPGSQAILCLTKVGEKIIQEKWYSQRQIDEATERKRIVRTAANIVLEDIRSLSYDTSSYPPPNYFLHDVHNAVPETLREFLNTVITKYKKKPDMHTNRVTAIAHTIISASRPRTFMSPLLLGISSIIYQKYASKTLIGLLSSLGFCASYKDSVNFQISSILHPQPQQEAEFQQFVFDNADFNTKTIDGQNTFHAMGGIVCKTPKSSQQNLPILRETDIPPQESMSKFATTSLRHYKGYTNGLKNVTIKNNVVDYPISPTLKDSLWLFGKTSQYIKMPGWNTFMAKSMVDDYATSEVTVLPFINNQPSDVNTIYTSLMTAVETNKTDDMTIITFDQPLYLKAQQIVNSSSDSRFKQVFVRLGGFHLLMSFMGCIGYVMSGSGLKELWCTIYAALSTEKMLTGHAYSRAIRAHSLTRCALFPMIMQTSELSFDEKLQLEEALDVILNDETIHTLDETAQNALFDKFQSDLEKGLKKLEERGPTALLWIQYFKMVTLVVSFLIAERSGNWQLHIDTIKKMLPFFHAAGHFLYAKCCQLYIQDAESLVEKMPAKQYENFAKKGFFTVRRSVKFWSGIFSDQTIEQTLMRSMKSAGGLTRGRGLTDGVFAKWIQAAPVLSAISEAVEQFCGFEFTTVDTHVDGRPSRIDRDTADLQKLGRWLQLHNPFLPRDSLQSLSSGVVGGDTINCHKAAAVGSEMMITKIGQNFQDVSYSRKDRVIPLSAVNSAIKVQDTNVPIEPETIFRRISFTKKSQEELKTYFEYELAPYPLSLFDESGMRKGNKAILCQLAQPIEECAIVKSESKLFVIDGGFLLHRVVWQKGVTSVNICETYVTYVKKHFGTNAIIVFDGYNTNSTKSAERYRRSKGKAVAEIMLDVNTLIPVNQEAFLTNEINKMRLIDLLMIRFDEASIPTKQSCDDADVLIVKTAIEHANEYDNVFIVGNDVDLLAILCGLTNKSNVYLQKIGSGKVQTAFYSSKSFPNPKIKKNILFIHAVSGCDTTSAMFRQGKKKVAKLIKTTVGIDDLLRPFSDSEADHNSIIKAGQKVLCMLYGENTQNLQDIRYKVFARLISKSKFNLASLPPSPGAATQHILRVYHQIQKWLGNDLQPTDWGWKEVNDHLEPVRTLCDPAPKEILDLISCRCKNLCKQNCTCKKAGINCTALCIHCDDKICHGIENESDGEDFIEQQLDVTDDDQSDQENEHNDFANTQSDTHNAPKKRRLHY